MLIDRLVEGDSCRAPDGDSCDHVQSVVPEHLFSALEPWARIGYRGLSPRSEGPPDENPPDAS